MSVRAVPFLSVSSLLFVLGFWLVPSGALAAEDEATVLRIRGERLAGQGRCEEALPLLERALAANPREGRAALVAGQCEIRLRRYPQAVARLEEAKRRAPRLAGVHLYLGIARFHQGDLSGAEAALEDAAPASGDRAEFHLYRGLLLLQREESEEAAAALERARSADPRSVEPVASYYAALAWAGAEQRRRARQTLERVITEAPGSVWAEEARRSLRDLQGGERRVWWLSATSGFEYDDNVILRGDAVRSALVPGEIGRGHDGRAVWRLDAGSELFRSSDASAGFVASYSGSAHQDLSDFNDQYPALSLWVDRRFSEATTARLQYDVGYVWFEGDPFVFPQSVTAALYRDWGGVGLTRFFARFYRYNYLFANTDDPRTPLRDEEPRRNRDGQGTSVGFEHSFPLGLGDTKLRGGYAFHRYSSRGSEYSFQAHEVEIGMRSVLPYEFILDTAVSGTYKPYRNASTFFVVPPARHERRSDDVWRAAIGLERPLNEYVTASVRYQFLQNHSNVELFDYDREILGAYLTVRFHD